MSFDFNQLDPRETDDWVIEWPKTPFDRYHVLAAELLNVDDVAIFMASSGSDVFNVGGLSSKDNERLCAVVCRLMPGLSRTTWGELDIDQRIEWMTNACLVRRRSAPKNEDDLCETPWDDGTWSQPKTQVARILTFMWDKDEAEYDDFAAGVWSKKDVKDGTIRKAINAANHFLQMNGSRRVLVSEKACVRWS